MYLLETIVRSGGLYGAEIWGWEKWETIERLQGRYTKAAMGLNRNTPAYIWRMEAGKGSVELESREMAGRYLIKIIKMKEERWPKVCLREELRELENKYPSKWGKSLKKAFEEVGDGEGLGWLASGEMTKEIGIKLREGIKTKRDQEIQQNWGKIEGSHFCKIYKNLKEHANREAYWETSDRKLGKYREQWAKLRCGNVENRGFGGRVTNLCRICNSKPESLEHLWVCEVAKKEIKEEWGRIIIERMGLIVMKKGL